MTHEDSGHYAAKHSGGQKPDSRIAEAVNEKVSDKRITCAAAFQVAEKLNVTPAQVGMNLDLMEIRLNKCQMGLFGYGPQKKIVTPADTISPELEETIRASAAGSRMACESCWAIAKKAGCAKLDVSGACEALKIKISPCQLGAF
jgi:hypothetical protein